MSIDWDAAATREARARNHKTSYPGARAPARFREQVLTLPDATILHTGHGPSTTVERERTTNPFLIEDFGGRLV